MLQMKLKKLLLVAVVVVDLPQTPEDDLRIARTVCGR